jgi:membrane protein implicated in regulation of membrane protease activity
VPLDGQLWQPLAAGKPSPAAEGTSVRIFGLEGLAVKVEGIVVKVQKF